MEEIILKELIKHRGLDTCNDFVIWADKCDLEPLAKKIAEAITVTPCCTELNPEFEIGEQVLLTKRNVVTIETFCEDGMIEINDNYDYYKVDKEELTKRV